MPAVRGGAASAAPAFWARGLPPTVVYGVLDDGRFGVLSCYCGGTRSGLVTGRNHTTYGMACPTEGRRVFRTTRPPPCATMAGVLGENGFSTAAVGPVASDSKGREEFGRRCTVTEGSATLGWVAVVTGHVVDLLVQYGSGLSASMATARQPRSASARVVEALGPISPSRDSAHA